MPHRGLPHEVLQHIGLLLGVAHALGEGSEQAPRQIVHEGVEPGEVDGVALLTPLGAADLVPGGLVDPRVAAAHRGHDPVHQAPIQSLRRRDRLVQVEDLPRALVPDDERQPLRGARARHRAHVGAHLLQVRVLRHDREVARQLALVPAPHRHAVDAGDDRFAGVENALDIGAEQRHVLPVVSRGADVRLGVLLHVAARAEGAVAGAGQDDHADRVVEARVPERRAELIEGGGRVGVVVLRPIDRDAGNPAPLLVQHISEGERGGGAAFEQACRHTLFVFVLSLPGESLGVNRSSKLQRRRFAGEVVEKSAVPCRCSVSNIGSSAWHQLLPGSWPRSRLPPSGRPPRRSAPSRSCVARSRADWIVKPAVMSPVAPWTPSGYVLKSI